MATLLRSIRRYAFPLALLAAGLFFQLVVLPSNFPHNHYEVLGLRRFASISEVADAYHKLSSTWDSGVEVPTVSDFVKKRYAFELLTHPTWKRDYDGFSFDEQFHKIEKIKKNYSGAHFSKIKLPLLNVPSSDTDEHSFNDVTTESFVSNVGKATPWLVQVYSSGSAQCSDFSDSWKRIGIFLDGVAETGAVELSNVELASFLAEKRHTGQAVFRNGLPGLVAFPSNCSSSSCYRRYEGDLTTDAVVDWMASSVLGLPRILYYSKESLDQNFIRKSSYHKVKVICFSATGHRALPFMRKLATDYQAYASFALVLWQEEDSSFWFERFQVESAPSILIIKDPGVKPVVHHGSWNITSFANLLEQNKHQVLPQLRSATSMELGCDPRGKSRAKNDTVAWYCVILAGRPGWQLNNMRETMREVQKTLGRSGSEDVSSDFSVRNPAADALRQKRLTFVWLDGDRQEKFCSFFLQSERSYETCGSRRFADVNDVPRLFLVRYKRNLTEDTSKVEKKKMKSIWDRDKEVDTNLASLLVARYNGSEETLEIIEWITQTIQDGDTRNLPYFRAQTPELISEDADPTIIQDIQRALFNWSAIRNLFKYIKTSFYDRCTDPRLGPILLLVACISYGAIYLQDTNLDKKVEDMAEGSSKKRRERRPVPRDARPLPFVRDVEPKDTYQAWSSGSDTE